MAASILGANCSSLIDKAQTGHAQVRVPAANFIIRFLKSLENYYRVEKLSLYVSYIKIQEKSKTSIGQRGGNSYGRHVN